MANAVLLIALNKGPEFNDRIQDMHPDPRASPSRQRTPPTRPLTEASSLMYCENAGTIQVRIETNRKINSTKAAARLSKVRQNLGYSDTEIDIRLQNLSEGTKLIRELQGVEVEIESARRILAMRRLGPRNDVYETVKKVEEIGAATRCLLDHLGPYDSDAIRSDHVESHASMVLGRLKQRKENLRDLQYTLLPLMGNGILAASFWDQAMTVILGRQSVSSPTTTVVAVSVAKLTTSSAG